jgi:hypothetical protein
MNSIKRYMMMRWRADKRLAALHREQQQCNAYQFEGRHQDTGDKHHGGNRDHAVLNQFYHAGHDGARSALTQRVNGHDGQQVGRDVQNCRTSAATPRCASGCLGRRACTRAPQRVQVCSSAVRVLPVQFVTLGAYQNASINRTHESSSPERACQI